jgi:hypothetical protein
LSPLPSGANGGHKSRGYVDAEKIDSLLSRE